MGRIEGFRHGLKNMITPQAVRDLTNFLEGEVSGAKKVLKWISEEMAKEELKQKADEIKQNEENTNA